MKRLFYIISFVLIFMINNVANAESYLNLDGGPVFDSEVNEDYIASGKKYEFTIEGSTSEIRFGSGEEAVLVEKERVKSIKVSISASSGVSCTVKNLKSSYYDLSNNTFTLKDNNAPTDSLNGNIGGISCSFPTTNDVIKLSSSNYLNITLETTDINVAPETPTTKNSKATYKYHFGILNENFIKSLNHSKSMTSAKVDGEESQGFKAIDVDKASVTLSIAQNELASKNKLYLTVDSEKKGPVIKKQEIKAGDKTINLPYGGVSIQVEELTERQIYLDNLFGNKHYGLEGFSSMALFSDPGYGTIFLFNRLDKRSKVNTLKSLMISNVSISFKSDLKNYIATVPYKVSSVTINSVLTDPKSSYVKGYGNRTVSLKEGTNTVQVKVKAENESVATYTIKITRDKNDDASLKSITVDDEEITTKDNLLVYSIKVKNEVVKPTIKAIPTDSKAKVSIEKFDDLVVGDNEINITVTASNGNKCVYVLNIIRDTLISTDSKLKNLEVKGQEINFDTEKTEYNVHINYDVDKLDLVVEPNHEKAKYIVTGNKDLENGSVIKIKVTAEDGETISNYTINVEKEKKPFNILYVAIPVGVLLLGGVIFLITKGKKNKGNTVSTSPTEPEVKPVEEVHETVHEDSEIDEIVPGKSE